MTPFAALLAALPSDPRRRGLEFERVCQWFLRNDPVYAARLRRVWLWRDWPERRGPDAGIDLVAETSAGELWAIQAKAYDPKYSITKRDIDTFLSESSQPMFSYRLMIATTDGIGLTARRTVDAQAVPVGLFLRSQLERADVRWPQSVDQLKPGPPIPKRPLPHSEQAIRDVCREFAVNPRGQLIMACGTGKTLIGLWVSEQLGSQRTLVLLPSLTLLAQTLHEWSANATEAFDWLAVCSDRGVASEDALVERTAEMGIPVTTDPDAIARFLRRTERRLVVFATYQSSPQLTASMLGMIPGFDLAIADEAHRCVGLRTAKFATILDEEKIPAARRLFMTATPRYFTGRTAARRQQGAELEIASMDQASLFGPVFHRLSFGKAINEGLLSDYQVAIVGVDNAEYRAYAQRAVLVTLNGERVTDARTLAGQVGLAKSMFRYGLRRVVSFHSRVKAAREFSRSFNDVVTWMPGQQELRENVWSHHVSGQMLMGERERHLAHFRQLGSGERGLLSNARCLGEGVDVPAIDGVAFIDPRRSAVDIIQAVGRAIRQSQDKTVGTIVLPVLIDPDEDPDTALRSSAFLPVWEVLRALRAHDNVLAGELDALRREFGRTKGTRLRLPAKIHIDLPVTIGPAFAEACTVHLVDETTAAWEFWCGLLERFAARECHAAVPVRHEEDGLRLGSWVNRQRTDRLSGELSEERAEQLEAVPGWSWNVHHDAWQHQFSALKRFIAREGHSRVSQKHVEDGVPLGLWVSAQRAAHHAKRLKPGRDRLLADLPGWSWDAVEDGWEDAFAILGQYCEREDHARVPKAHREDGFLLGRWVGRQRVFRTQGSLSPQRSARLEALPGWSWDTFATEWQEAFEVLNSYVLVAGHARVPVDHIEHGFPLGQWCHVQRRARKRGKLEPNRAALLDQVPGWYWDPGDHTRNNGMAALRIFAEREGDARVPAKHMENGFPLGAWVNTQRTLHKRGKLNNNYVAELESVDGWVWDAVEASWNDAFAALNKFAERERHTRIPRGHVEDGISLANWVLNQRASYSRGALRVDRRERLEGLSAWRWSLRG